MSIPIFPIPSPYYPFLNPIPSYCPPNLSRYAPKPDAPLVPLRPVISESPAELRASYESFLPGAKAPKGKRPTPGTRQPPHLAKAGGKNYRQDSEMSHTATESETDLSYASDVPPRKNVRR